MVNGHPRRPQPGDQRAAGPRLPTNRGHQTGADRAGVGVERLSTTHVGGAHGGLGAAHDEGLAGDGLQGRGQRRLRDQRVPDVALEDQALAQGGHYCAQQAPLPRGRGPVADPADPAEQRRPIADQGADLVRLPRRPAVEKLRLDCAGERR